MSKTTNTSIKIEEPAKKLFLGQEGGETGNAYYVYTDGLGCQHLTERNWGCWYRVDPATVATEMLRCADLNKADIAAQVAAEAPLCTYDYMYRREADYRRLYAAISGLFPQEGNQ